MELYWDKSRSSTLPRSSKTPMSHQLAPDAGAVTPGPGAYASATTFNPRRVPENLQTFGSTQKRLASDNVTTSERQRAAQPGPGAYDEKRTAFKGRHALLV